MSGGCRSSPLRRIKKRQRVCSLQNLHELLGGLNTLSTNSQSLTSLARAMLSAFRRCRAVKPGLVKLCKPWLMRREIRVIIHAVRLRIPVTHPRFSSQPGFLRAADLNANHTENASMHEVVVKNLEARSRYTGALPVSYLDHHRLRALFDAPSSEILHLDPTCMRGTLPLGGEI
jgi:hypothetical protein